jgi:hypothetical protein
MMLELLVLLALAAFNLFARRSIGGADFFGINRGKWTAGAIVINTLLGSLVGPWQVALAAAAAAIMLWTPGHGVLYDIGSFENTHKKLMRLDVMISRVLTWLWPKASWRTIDIVGMHLRFGAWGFLAGNLVNLPGMLGRVFPEMGYVGAPYSVVPVIAFGFFGLMISWTYIILHDMKVDGTLRLKPNHWLKLHEYYCHAELLVGVFTGCAIFASVVSIAEAM